jgi:BolA protein|tara:strand:+ start:43 stop:351 length:309 start_codon:yes stop_codon:yes gene_type:complete
MSVAEEIEEKLAADLPLKHLLVVNESSNHNVPAGSESHFKVVMVSDEFAGMRLLKRHQRINQILAAELAGPVHALSMHTYTEDEWRARGDAPMSPPCLGGAR